MKKYDFAEGFPRMTASFKSKVEQEVLRQIHGGAHATGKPKRARGRIAAVICAVIALSGVTAYAVGSRLLPELDKANADASTLVQSSPETEFVEDAWQPQLPEGTINAAEEDLAVLTIDETLFDGALLHIYATETQAGAQYDLNSDGILINGENFANDIFRKTTDGYYIMANLSSLDISGDFSVTLPVSVYEKHDTSVAYDANSGIPEYKRYPNQEFVFTIEHAQAISSATRHAKPQRLDGDGYYVNLHKLTLTPTASNISFSITFTGDAAKKNAQAFGEYLISASSGNETLYGGDNSDLITGSSSKPEKTGDGYAIADIDWTLRALNDAGDEITITPYVHAGSSREMKDEYSFSVPLFAGEY